MIVIFHNKKSNDYRTGLLSEISIQTLVEQAKAEAQRLLAAATVAKSMIQSSPQETADYEIKVTEPIDAFNKLRIESKFQKLSPGGAISYVEVPNMAKNIDAVLEVIKYIYDHIMYAELNTKLDYCQKCGFSGEIQIIEDEESGKLVWECPNCGNRDQDTMNVIRRTCG